MADTRPTAVNLFWAIEQKGSLRALAMTLRWQTALGKAHAITKRSR